MKSVTILTWLPLFVAGNLIAQSFPATAMPLLGAEEMAASIVSNVCSVGMATLKTNLDDLKDYSPLGSGFFVQETNHETIVAITCTHVVKLAVQAKKDVFVAMDTVEGLVRLPCLVLFMSETNDIAVLIPIVPPGKQFELKNAALSAAKLDDGGFLVLGRGALTAGYPLGLGNEEGKNHPVVRVGFIAQAYGQTTFLLDGVASHGSSGSPVYALFGGKYKCVGMVSRHYLDYDEQAQTKASVPYNAGLVLTVRASVIRQAIDSACK